MNKTLFLTSITENVLHKFPDLIDKTPVETKVAFIPTAGDVYEDKSFIQTDRAKWIELGYNLREVDLKNKNENQLRSHFEDCEIIYLSGGNVFYLLQEANKCGLSSLLEEFLNQGKILAGGSAGAAIFGPSLEPLQTIDDPAKAPELDDCAAFGFVDFVVLPHFDDKKFHGRYVEIMKQNSQFKFKPLNNDQAIFVSGDEVKLV